MGTHAFDRWKLARYFEVSYDDFQELINAKLHQVQSPYLDNVGGRVLIFRGAAPSLALKEGLLGSWYKGLPCQDQNVQG